MKAPIQLVKYGIYCVENQLIIGDKTVDIAGSAVEMAKLDRLLAVITLQKQLVLLNLDTLEQVQVPTFKKCNKVILLPLSCVVCDKFGDVYCYPIVGFTLGKPRMLLGHVSNITDMLLTDKYLITADRDEKIRVNCFPNTYNIHRFLLGHEHCITKLLIIGNILISGGSDSYLLLWDYGAGELLQKLELPVEKMTIVSNIEAIGNQIFITLEGHDCVFLFELGQELVFERRLELEREPLSLCAADTKLQISLQTIDSKTILAIETALKNDPSVDPWAENRLAPEVDTTVGTTLLMVYDTTTNVNPHNQMFDDTVLEVNQLDIQKPSLQDNHGLSKLVKWANWNPAEHGYPVNKKLKLGKPKTKRGGKKQQDKRKLSAKSDIDAATVHIAPDSVE